MNAKSTRARPHPKEATAAVRQRAKRMPAEARKEVILKEASDFFALNGFAASTRDLADRIGVRQALLYKYFPSKEALIEAIFDRLIHEREASPRATLSRDGSKPLADRIADVYDHIASLAGGSGVRLLSRAILQDLPTGVKLAAFLMQKLFLPILEEIRGLEKLPSVADKPMMVGEYELIMAMHAGSLFFLLRRNLRNSPLPDNPVETFHACMESFIAGARSSVRELHAAGTPRYPSLVVAK